MYLFYGMMLGEVSVSSDTTLRGKTGTTVRAVRQST